MKKIRKLNDGFDLQSTVRGTTLSLTDECMYDSVHSVLHSEIEIRI